MKEIILLKDGEIVLKGLNRRTFEDVLKKNIKHALSPLGSFEIRSAQSIIYVKPLSDDIDLDEACLKISRVFGIVSYSRAAICEEKTLESIMATAPVYLEKELKAAKTFKVEARRSDKRFPYKSPEICAELGGVILDKFPHLSVDVHNPDLIVNVEVRDFGAYVHGAALRGAGGIPVGTSGNAAILISGGIYDGEKRLKTDSNSLCKSSVHKQKSGRQGCKTFKTSKPLRRQNDNVYGSVYKNSGNNKK